VQCSSLNIAKNERLLKKEEKNIKMSVAVTAVQIIIKHISNVADVLGRCTVYCII